MAHTCHKCGCLNHRSGDAQGLYSIAGQRWCWKCAAAEIKRLQTHIGQLTEWSRGLHVRRFLREHQNRLFQMPGRYDGAMSRDCKELCEQERLTTEWLLELSEAAESKQGNP